MALILSIETATKTCSVALHLEGELIAIQELHVANSHAESLLLIIEHLLAITAHPCQELAAIAISHGPGSYTGLRIGAATAKGLCYALNIPLIAIGTLEAMAHHVNSYNTTHDLLCPMLDARRMEVYCLVIDADGKLIKSPHAKVIDEYSFSTLLADNRVVFFGDGANKCKAALQHNPNAIFIDDISPTAHTVGVLAFNKFKQGAFADLTYFEHFYLKPFQGRDVAKNNA